MCLSVHTGAKKLDVQRILPHGVVGSAGEDGIIQRCAHIYNGQNAGVDGTFLCHLFFVPVWGGKTLLLDFAKHFFVLQNIVIHSEYVSICAESMHLGLPRSKGNPFFAQVKCTRGTPSAWHTTLASLLPSPLLATFLHCGPFWSSGGTAEKHYNNFESQCTSHHARALLISWFILIHNSKMSQLLFLWIEWGLSKFHKNLHIFAISHQCVNQQTQSIYYITNRRYLDLYANGSTHSAQWVVPPHCQGALYHCLLYTCKILPGHASPRIWLTRQFLRLRSPLLDLLFSLHPTCLKHT